MAARLAIAGGKPTVDAARHVRWPVLNEQDRAAVLGVLERGVLSGPFAPEVRGLEREFAAWLGSRHALATNSGTAALHVAIAAAGVGPGDEVITPAFSFVATAMAVLHHGAIPVFVDIEPATFGIDPAKIEAAITERTRAIVPVHLHGVPCRIEEVAAIARKHRLTLIEDAAQAHGASWKGRRVGTFGAFGCFSLQSSKNLACGEGGLAVTDDPELLQRANRTRMFGEDVRPEDEAGYRLERALDGDRAYDSRQVGWMYRTTEMSAALARSQLRRLDAMNEQARRNASLLSEALAKLPGVTPPAVPEGAVPAWHKYRVRLDASKVGVDAPPRRVRDAVLSALKAEGVDAVLWQTQPVPGQTLFRQKVGYGKARGGQIACPWDHGRDPGYDPAQFPETRALLDASLCLFSHTYPIAPQPQELALQYAEAFARVWTRLDEVLAAEGAGASA
ncbi:MAG: DegT/DnrJ/EryC1/StrS family aminotransferase [Myxococcales bacterium]